MVNKDYNQQSIRNSNDAQLILKALNTNWRVKIDNNIHKEVLKFLNGHFNRRCIPYIYSVNDLVDYYSQGFFVDVDHVKFYDLENKEKEFFCMMYMSTLYTKWLINDFELSLSKKKEGLTYNLELENKKSDSGDAGVKKMLLAMAMMMAAVPGRKQDSLIDLGILDIKEYSSTPFLSRVFGHLIQIKRSFSLFLEIFYRIIGQMDLSLFDYKTYNTLNDSVIEEKYEQFRDIIYGWDTDIISGLSIIFEQLYPIFIFLEINISKEKQNILDRTRYFLTERNLAKNFRNHQPVTIETSLTSFILVTLINYLAFNFLNDYLSQDVSECFHYFWHQNNLTTFHRDYKEWIDKNMKKQLYFFQNTAGVSLIDDSQTIKNNGLEEDNEDKNHITQDQANHYPKQQQELGSSDETGNPPEDKPKRHLSVGHDIEAIKKLATYLVKGFTNTRGSLPALVSSNDEKNITINKLIFLFTGNKDYSFDGQYNLTWNAERVYLKLLIKLLHNLNELATGSHAVDTNRADYISDKYIKCKLTGGVWPKVAEAFENIKSEATIRNADYKKNYKDTTAPINQKRLKDMKVIADLWLKCKNDIDF